MYSIDKYRRKIRVQLPNGLYRFAHLSASGKSYLVKVLQIYRGYGEPVGTYTYLDYREGVDLMSRARGCKLFVVDRYDMYYGYALEEMRALSEDCVVLVDFKGVGELKSLSTCGLVLLEEGFVIR